VQVEPRQGVLTVDNLLWMTTSVMICDIPRSPWMQMSAVPSGPAEGGVVGQQGTQRVEVLRLPGAE